MGQRQREQVQRGCAVGTSGWLADLMLGAGMVLSAAGYWMERKRCLAPEGPASPPGLFLLAARPVPAEKKNRAAPHLCGAVLSGCAGRRTGFRGFRKGAAQRAVFFSSGASGAFSRFSSGISSLLMMVSICSSFFTSSLGKRLFTRWTTVLR